MADGASSSRGDDSLDGIFLVEFDNQYGRTLAFQEPARTISLDDFDAFSEYLIPKPQLCGRLIVLRFSTRAILCWPVCLEDERYERNAFIFCLGFVIGGGVSERDACERHGALLRKACAHLAALELETALLSDASRNGELAHLLPRILYGLRERGECAVAADAANTIHLQLPPRPSHTLRAAGSAAEAVEPHKVPLLLAVPETAEVRLWDLTLQKLLRWIDGTMRTVDLALAAHVDLPLVTQGLQALVAAGWVRVCSRSPHRSLYAIPDAG